MTIIENKKKLAIIGNGTAGCLSSAFFNRNMDWEVEWYFDPNIKPQSVGEGSTIPLPFSLYNDDCKTIYWFFYIPCHIF